MEKRTEINKEEISKIVEKDECKSGILVWEKHILNNIQKIINIFENNTLDTKSKQIKFKLLIRNKELFEKFNSTIAIYDFMFRKNPDFSEKILKTKISNMDFDNPELLKSLKNMQYYMDEKRKKVDLEWKMLRVKKFLSLNYNRENDKDFINNANDLYDNVYRDSNYYDDLFYSVIFNDDTTQTDRLINTDVKKTINFLHKSFGSNSQTLPSKKEIKDILEESSDYKIIKKLYNTQVETNNNIILSDELLKSCIKYIKDNNIENFVLLSNNEKDCISNLFYKWIKIYSEKEGIKLNMSKIDGGVGVLPHIRENNEPNTLFSYQGYSATANSYLDKDTQHLVYLKENISFSKEEQIEMDAVDNIVKQYGTLKSGEDTIFTKKHTDFNPEIFFKEKERLKKLLVETKNETYLGM